MTMWFDGTRPIITNSPTNSCVTRSAPSQFRRKRATLPFNALLLLWIGRVVGNRVTLADAGAIYISSVLCSAAMIQFVHHLHPKVGATMGASGCIFYLLAAALIILYREKADPVSRQRRLRALLWIALLARFGVSLLPGISMAGHLGGLIGGAFVAPFARFRTK